MFTCGLLRSNFSFAISFSAPQSNSFQIPMTPRLLFATRLLDNFFGKTRGHLRIVREMHGEISAALCAAAQIRGVAEHLRQRHFHPNDVAAAAILRTLNRRT